MLEKLDAGQDDVENQWKKPWITYRMDVCRRGWWGVWDSIVALWTKKQLTVKADFTFSIYVKMDESVDVFALQLEQGKVIERYCVNK